MFKIGNYVSSILYAYFAVKIFIFFGVYLQGGMSVTMDDDGRTVAVGSVRATCLPETHCC